MGSLPIKDGVFPMLFLKRSFPAGGYFGDPPYASGGAVSPGKAHDGCRGMPCDIFKEAFHGTP